jgi:hypothetical protein
MHHHGRHGELGLIYDHYGMVAMLQSVSYAHKGYGRVDADSVFGTFSVNADSQISLRGSIHGEINLAFTQSGKLNAGTRKITGQAVVSYICSS